MDAKAPIVEVGVAN